MLPRPLTAPVKTPSLVSPLASPLASLLASLLALSLVTPAARAQEAPPPAQGGEGSAEAAPPPREEQEAPRRELKTLWNFEGPLAPSLKAIAQERYGERAAGHIFERAALEEHLARHLSPERLAPLEECARDGGSCDLGALLLEGGALKGRVFVSATELSDGLGFSVSVEWHKRGAASPERFSATEPTLDRACAVIFERALQVGTLTLKGLPAGGALSVGGEPVSLSQGLALLEAGEHEITLSAPDHEPLTAKVEIKPALTTELTVKMIPSSGSFKVMVLGDELMRDLRATLNGEPLAVGAVVRLPSKREHTLRVEATDRSTYDLTFSLNPSEARTQTVELPFSRPYWKIALKSPHPDVQVSTHQVYARFIGSSISGGSWEANVSGAGGDAKLARSQAYGVGAWGLDAGLRWGVDPSSPTGSLQLDLVGVAHQRLSGAIALSEGTPGQPSDCAPSRPCEGLTLTNLSRTLTRVLWVGYQLPMWRVTPYLNGGLVWAYEAGSLKGGGEVSAHSLRLGWEAGVDVTLSPEWVLKAALVADAWIDSRASYQVAVGAAYAFTLF